MDWGRTTTLFYKNITLTLYSRKRLKLQSCAMDGQRQIKTDCYILPLLTIARCVIFKTQISSVSVSRLRMFNRRSLTAAALSVVLSQTASWLNCHGRLHILFHNAHKLSIRSCDLLPLIHIGASLIDNLVKVQYVTCVSPEMCRMYFYISDIFSSKSKKKKKKRKISILYTF